MTKKKKELRFEKHQTTYTSRKAASRSYHHFPISNCLAVERIINRFDSFLFFLPSEKFLLHSGKWKCQQQYKIFFFSNYLQFFVPFFFLQSRGFPRNWGRVLRETQPHMPAKPLEFAQLSPCLADALGMLLFEFLAIWWCWCPDL